jgi:hypothetical protein
MATILAFELVQSLLRFSRRQLEEFVQLVPRILLVRPSSGRLGRTGPERRLPFVDLIDTPPDVAITTPADLGILSALAAQSKERRTRPYPSLRHRWPRSDNAGSEDWRFGQQSRRAARIAVNRA